MIKQICEAEDITILSGVINSDHVHLHIEYLPSKCVSDIVKRLKGRTSRRIQEEFTHISKSIWGGIFELLDMGFGVLKILPMRWCKKILNITELQQI